MDNLDSLRGISFDPYGSWPSVDQADLLVGTPLEPQSVPSSPGDSAEPEAAESLHDRDRRRTSSNHKTLPFLQLANWREDAVYNEQPPTCIHYSIEWKLVWNGKVLTRDTEPNLVLAPGIYWTKFLHPKLEKLVAKKLANVGLFIVDDTNVIASVRDRTERDLVKCFDGLAVDWNIIETQLRAWSPLFRKGKRLRLDIAFNYVETNQQDGTSTQQGNKRGTASATRAMLSDRAKQLDAEQASGQSSLWRDVYNLMRCPGPPCHLGPYCWRDSTAKKHYRLKTHHLRSLIKYVEQGHALQDHEDVPGSIREQLYAEEQQHVERKRKRDASSPNPLPPIQITNVMPSPASQALAEKPLSTPSSPIKIEGTRDTAVRRYCDWQCSQVADVELQWEFQRARDLTLADGLDLEQLYEEQDFQFLVEKGIKRGIARRFVRDIQTWVQQNTII